MARRYSRPKARLCTRKDGSKFWETRFWRYELRSDGIEERTHPRIIVGNLEDFPTQRLANREAQRLHDDAAKSFTPAEQPNNLNLFPAHNPNPKALVSFEVFADRWEQEIAIHQKFSTRETARHHLNKWLLPHFGKMRLGDVRAEAVQLFFNAMRNKGSTKLIRNVRNTLTSILRQARVWEYITHDPTNGLVLPKYKPTKKRAYTVEQVAQIIANAKERYRTLYYFLAETGVRSGECALDIADVDLANRTVGISQAVWRGHTDTPKTDSSVRVFHISARLAEMLAGQIGNRSGGPVFVSRNNTPLDLHNLLNRNLKPLLLKLGLGFGDLHTFRHFNATVMDSLRVPDAVKRRRLGHGDSSITHGYEDAFDSDDKAASEKISASILNNLESLYPDCTLGGYTLTSAHS
jgi:integrase